MEWIIGLHLSNMILGEINAEVSIGKKRYTAGAIWYAFALWSMVVTIAMAAGY
jgi:hypothetical protein